MSALQRVMYTHMQSSGILLTEDKVSTDLLMSIRDETHPWPLFLERQGRQSEGDDEHDHAAA